MKIKHIIFLIALIGTMGFEWPFSFSQTNGEPLGSKAWLDKQTRIILSQASNINPTVLRLSLVAYIKARKKGYDNKQLLTVIDYSKPSSEKRMWIFDLGRGKTLYNTWVTHGKNSGGVMATSFSNTPGSLKSSIGVFTTDYVPYMGGNGYSLRLHGLERGINDNAYSRDIVIHGAWYANPATIRRYGQIGRSWGCPAVDESKAHSIIDTIKSNTLVFAYYPDRKWLSQSQYLVG